MVHNIFISKSINTITTILQDSLKYNLFKSLWHRIVFFLSLKICFGMRGREREKSITIIFGSCSNLSPRIQPARHLNWLYQTFNTALNRFLRWHDLFICSYLHGLYITIFNAVSKWCGKVLGLLKNDICIFKLTYLYVYSFVHIR